MVVRQGVDGDPTAALDSEGWMVGVLICAEIVGGTWTRTVLNVAYATGDVVRDRVGVGEGLMSGGGVWGEDEDEDGDEDDGK